MTEQDQINQYNTMALIAGQPEIEQPTASEFAEKFLGVKQKSAFEAALIRNGVEYITTSYGIVIDREKMDVELYGDLIGGYDITVIHTATIPHSEIK